MRRLASATGGCEIAAIPQYYAPCCVELRIKLSHQDLANIIGSTRETVTVVLGELQAEGCLKLGRRKIVLLDIARLADSVSVAVPRLSGA